MGCFSGNISNVSNTRIFARGTDQGTQYLVYQFDYKADNDLALIVPLPTPLGSASDAVRFIDLSGYPDFFEALANGFPVTRALPHAPSNPSGIIDGSFLASRADFSRLDEKYRLADEMWDRVPEYGDYGFAVFKLSGDAQTVPPLAIEFPTRSQHLLYFPTVKLQQGTFEENAYFDHDIYCQGQVGWLRSYDVAQAFVDVARAQGTVDGNQRIERFTVLGVHPNSDIVVTLNQSA